MNFFQIILLLLGIFVYITIGSVWGIWAHRAWNRNDICWLLRFLMWPWNTACDTKDYPLIKDWDEFTSSVAYGIFWPLKIIWSFISIVLACVKEMLVGISLGIVGLFWLLTLPARLLSKSKN